MGKVSSDDAWVEVFHACGLSGWESACDGLSHVERDRLARFSREQDRARSALAARLLREVAARRLGCAPGAVVVDRTCQWCGDQHGGPRLPGAGMHASVSHSGPHVVVALSSDPVGVDVEAYDDVKPPSACHVNGLADVILGPDENRPLTRRELLITWTRKESVLKLTGEGLRRPMNTLRVSAPWHQAELIAAPSLEGDIALGDLHLGTNVVGAVAASASSPVLVHRIDALVLTTSIQRSVP